MAHDAGYVRGPCTVPYTLMKSVVAVQIRRAITEWTNNSRISLQPYILMCYTPRFLVMYYPLLSFNIPTRFMSDI